MIEKKDWLFMYELLSEGDFYFVGFECGESCLMWD